MIGQGLALVTVRVTCEYYRELAAFDGLIIRMQLLDLSPHRMSLQFDYWVRTEKGEELAARGEQDLACMMRRDGKVEPAPWPESLREALLPDAPG